MIRTLKMVCYDREFVRTKSAINRTYCINNNRVKSQHHYISWALILVNISVIL